MKPLKKGFYAQDTLTVAKELIGKYLIHKTDEGELMGRIIETEAYLQNDPAAHAYVGKTKRNEAVYGPPGKAYVYFIYGMHYCFNVVTNKDKVGDAVLIRALEPIKGLQVMKKRRGVDSKINLTNGPAKLVEAMGITIKDNKRDLTKGNLIIAEDTKNKKNNPEVVQTTRVGISKAKDLKYRFYLKGSKFVSK